jgi:glycosyltransferase involved in cell wall biosynthesis
VLARVFEDQMWQEPRSDTGNRFRFLSVGFLVEGKNHAGLLRAFAAQFRGGSDVELRIGGDGPLRASLEKLASQLGVVDQVTFLGRLTRPEVLRQMQVCDGFVLPSDYETFSVVLIEALACGTPVVATACGGPEHIMREQDGILVPPRDPIALGQAMREMVRTLHSYDSEGMRRSCIERFGRDALVERLNRVYHEVLVRSARES